MISLLQQTAPVVVDQGPGPDPHGVVVLSDGAAAVGEPIVHPAPVGAEHAVGMPQLDVSTFGNQIFWLLVTLAVIFWVLSRIALPRIASVVSDRQGAITGDLMSAEEYKKKAKDAEAAYEKALTDARGEAGKIVAAQKAEIQKELDAAIAKADAEIAARTAESDQRIAEIRASSVEDVRSVAREVTAELLRRFGGEADPSRIDAAIDGRLKGGAA